MSEDPAFKMYFALSLYLSLYLSLSLSLYLSSKASFVQCRLGGQWSGVERPCH